MIVTMRLRFDVETLIIATNRMLSYPLPLLRFDVETLIIATYISIHGSDDGCGLM